MIQIAQDPSLSPEPEGLRVLEQPPYSVVGFQGRRSGFQRVMAVDEGMAACAGRTRQSLANDYRERIAEAVREYRQANTRLAWIRGTLFAGLVLGAYLFWLKLQIKTNAWLAHKIQHRYGESSQRGPSSGGDRQL